MDVQNTMDEIYGKFMNTAVDAKVKAKNLANAVSEAQFAIAESDDKSTSAATTTIKTIAEAYGVQASELIDAVLDTE